MSNSMQVESNVAGAGGARITGYPTPLIFLTRRSKGYSDAEGQLSGSIQKDVGL